jgi:hypothetical protein
VSEGWLIQDGSPQLKIDGLPGPRRIRRGPAPGAKRGRRIVSKPNGKGLRLVTAESCTAGLLASLLTDIEGCCLAFDRGFIAYGDEAKHRIVGVPQASAEQGWGSIRGGC